MIELHPHTAFEASVSPPPDWMCGDRAGDFEPFPHMLPHPTSGDYMQHLLAEHLCPECTEIIGGPECPHDWAAIAVIEQAGTPIIELRRSRG